MGHAMCICSRGTVTIENKRYYFIQKLDEGSAGSGRVAVRWKSRRSRGGSACWAAGGEVMGESAVQLKGSLWSELEKLRDKNSFMPESRILHIFRGICAGLKAIHDKGYAHRNCTKTHLVIACDDWAAQRCTISYRAPELFNVESHCIIDERTDIWSLGCVLYGMMMLEGPFDMIFQKGDSVALAVQNPVTVPQPCRYSEGLQSLLSSIMVPNPQERPDINWVLNQIRHVQPPETPGDPNSI
ncbi:STK16 kinase, partial [Atractosteus spatula]|nr:STK16 kinase [Atractosteus spatula]